MRCVLNLLVGGKNYLMVRRITIGLLAVTTLAIFASPLLAGEQMPSDISPLQKKAVEAVVREYILKNPEIIVEAIRSFQRKREVESQQQAQVNLSALRNELERDPSTPFGGNPDGDVTIVEFFDYQCPYCKSVYPHVTKLVKSDGKIRYVYIEFPILGPASESASRAALAVWKQAPTRYQQFHAALMQKKGPLSEPLVISIAQTMKLDIDRLKSDMAAAQTTDKLRRNRELAISLNIRGTPGFVIGGEVARGALGPDNLKKLVAAARNKRPEGGKVTPGPASPR